MAIILFTFLALLLWLSQPLRKLAANYKAAASSGLPFIVCPVDPDNIVWRLSSVYLRTTFDKWLPTAVNQRLKLATFGWEFHVKWAIHGKLGSIFILVTPGLNQVWIADPEAAIDVLARYKEFVKQPAAKKMLGFMGPNIVSADSHDWARQRRLIAPYFNERISATVWREGSRQAREMVESLSKLQATRVTVDGVRRIAFNVLSEVGYGQTYNWDTETQGGNNEDLQGDFGTTYFDAVKTIRENVIPLALLPLSVLRHPKMPARFQKFALAVQEFPSFSKQVLEHERILVAQDSTRSNFIAMLLSEHDAKLTNASAATQRLVYDEIQGNLFAFSAAGFDTTANSMIYAVALLAAYPKWQNWIAEELSYVLKGEETIENSLYQEVYPRLVRCEALMLEVLRLYPPIDKIMRCTDLPRTIERQGQSGNIHIPANSKVYVNFPALHTNPAKWGSDAMEFRPTRWLTEDSTLDKPKIITYDKAVVGYLAWSSGPRVCPGYKMSQVEFVTVIATLFFKYKAEPVRLEGETNEQAQQRLIGTTKNSAVRLALSMNRPNDVHLTWSRR